LVGVSLGELSEKKGFPNQFHAVSVLQAQNTLTRESNVNLDEGNEIILIGPEDKKAELDDFFERQ